MSNKKNRMKEQTAWLSVISNTLLVFLKLIVGFYTGAVSIISEAAHSAVDLLAALIAFFAVRTSSKPPDDNHAYGHGKYENLSAAAEALLIVGAAIWIVYESVGKFNSTEKPAALEYGIVIMLLSVVVNYFVSEKLLKVSRETHSQALEADALHLRADIWTSVGVLVGLAIIKITGLYWLDPAIAILVAVVIFKAGIEMTQKSVSELTDTSLPEEEETIIKDILNKNPDVITFHRLRTRRSGGYRLIDVHVILNKNMHLDKAHEISDLLENEIEGKLGLCDVVIHLEPCDYHEEMGACPIPTPEGKNN